MPDPTTIRAAIETLTAAGLDVSIRTEGGVAEVVVCDADTGQRFVVRDSGAWRAVCDAATVAGFDFEG